MKGKNSILLVDDDPDFLAANAMALRAAGFEVYEAGNSAEAMEIALRVAPTAAVLDVIMDEPDEGFALARAFRHEERTRNMLLVMLSSVNEVNRQKGLAFRFTDRDRDEHWLPVDRVLEKPIRPKQLTSILKDLMEGTP